IDPLHERRERQTGTCSANAPGQAPVHRGAAALRMDPAEERREERANLVLVPVPEDPHVAGREGHAFVTAGAMGSGVVRGSSRSQHSSSAAKGWGVNPAALNRDSWFA